MRTNVTNITKMHTTKFSFRSVHFILSNFSPRLYNHDSCLTLFLDGTKNVNTNAMIAKIVMK